MIISTSRRTDISAFYSEWFMNHIRAGLYNLATLNQIVVTFRKPKTAPNSAVAIFRWWVIRDSNAGHPD